MRGINKFDGDIQARDEIDQSLDSQEETLFKQYFSATFFASSRGASARLLKKFSNFCFNSTFAEPVIQTTDTSLTVVFPVCHQIHCSSSVKRSKWSRKDIYPLDETIVPIYSHIQLKITRIDAYIYLNVECKAFTDLYDYNVTDLLNNLTEIVNATRSSSGASGKQYLHVNTKVIYLDVINTEVNVRLLAINNGVDRVAIQGMVGEVSNYYVNCLKRFEELAIGREVNAYQTAQELGTLLLAVVDNYREVSPKEYQSALTLLTVLETNVTYQNDPHIWMSMTKIRNALTGLSEKALIVTDGIKLEPEQLALILDTLDHFEGERPLLGKWFSTGTVQRLAGLLKDLVPELSQGTSLSHGL